jgi:hypothetical protein
MKKLSLAFFTIGAALAITPAPLIGQSYNFLEFTGGGTTVTGTFTLVTPAIGTSPLDYNFATFNGTITGSNLDSGASVAVTLYSAYGSTIPGGSGPGFSIFGGSGNNQFYPNADATAGGVTGPPAYLDNYGLVLTDANGDIINIFANGNGSYYFFDDVYNGPGPDDFTPWQGTVSNGSLAVPEYGALSMLILSALTLAGGFFFKPRQSGLFPAA